MFGFCECDVFVFLVWRFKLGLDVFIRVIGSMSVICFGSVQNQCLVSTLILSG